MEATEISLLPPAVREPIPITDVPIFRRKRYFLVLMIWTGMGLMNLLRCTLPIAIVDMTSSKNVTVGDQVFVQDAEFKWTSFENGILLSVRQCLGMVCILGGVLSCKFGPIKTFGGSLLLNAVFVLVFPLTVHWSKPMFFIGRILEGATYYAAIGSWTQIFVKWAPSDERSRMVDSALSGFFIGGIISFPICGVIIDEWGWPWVFYFNGSLMILWWTVWFIFIYEDPSKDKFISKEEKNYILKNTKPSMNQNSLPWKRILRSKKCWALVNERFVEAWTLSFAFEFLPLYVKDSLGVSIAEVGFITSIPQTFQLLGVLFGGYLNDFFRNHNMLHPHQLSAIIASRVLVLAGEISCAVLYVSIGLIENFIVSTFLMCLLRFAYGWASSAFAVLPIEIAGEYAGLLHGIAVASMTVGSVLNPILTSTMTQNHAPAEWRHYFLVLSGFNIWAAIIFYFCGSGQPETWTNVEKKPIQYESVEMKRNTSITNSKT